MTGFPQGFTLPNRNASGWDSDLNANFGLLERGFVMPFVVGTAAVNTGTLIQAASFSTGTLGIANIYQFPAGNPPDALALQAGSPGNVVYGLVQGALTDFAAYSGQLLHGSVYGASVVTPGWVTSSFDQAPQWLLGRCLQNGVFTFNPTPRAATPYSRTESGMSHCASGTLGVFSFAMMVGTLGMNTLVRVRSNSCDNYRLTFYANSGRSTIIYDTVINSGNLGVRTIDMQDAATWVYSLGVTPYPLYGIIHGALQVLSSAATAINSQNFQVTFAVLRFR